MGPVPFEAELCSRQCIEIDLVPFSSLLAAPVSLSSPDWDDASAEGAAGRENAHIAGRHQDAAGGAARDQGTTAVGARLQPAGIRSHPMWPLLTRACS